jgi:hypothetical protein
MEQGNVRKDNGFALSRNNKYVTIDIQEHKEG